MAYHLGALDWQTEVCRYGPERGVGVGDDRIHETIAEWIRRLL